MINSKFKIKKLLNLILQVLTYTVTICIVSSFFMKLDLTQILKSIFPISYAHYWFITNYILLYILSPFINKLINNMTKKEHSLLIIILVMIQSVIDLFLNAEFEMGKFIWFITLYLIGAFIQKYYKPSKKSIKINAIGTIVSYLLLVISVVGLDFLSKKIALLQGHELYFTKLTSIFVLINSIFLFLLFRNINIDSSKFINKISSATLGVYIIHENIIAKNFIWKIFGSGAQYFNSNYFIVHTIISVLGMFVLCSIIELLRQALIQPLQNKFVDFVVSKGNELKVVVREKAKQWI